MNNFKLSIPKPCHEKWDGMAPDAQGRFCGQCQKTVTDFTGMSNAQINAYVLQNDSKKICGRFEVKQLKPQPYVPQIPLSVLTTQTSFRKMFMLALFITMGTTLFSCKDHNNNDILVGEVVAIDTTANATDTLKALPEDSDSQLAGKVKKCDSSAVKSGRKLVPSPFIKSPPPLMGDVVITKPDSARALPVPPPVEHYPAPKSIVKEED